MEPVAPPLLLQAWGCRGTADAPPTSPKPLLWQPICHSHILQIFVLFFWVWVLHIFHVIKLSVHIILVWVSLCWVCDWFVCVFVGVYILLIDKTASFFQLNLHYIVCSFSFCPHESATILCNVYFLWKLVQTEFSFFQLLPFAFDKFFLMEMFKVCDDWSMSSGWWCADAVYLMEGDVIYRVWWELKVIFHKVFNLCFGGCLVRITRNRWDCWACFEFASPR